MRRVDPIWVLVAAVVALLLAPGLIGGPTLDGAVFAHIGGALRDGLLPYRDVWDHKPPGIYALFALVEMALSFVRPWVAVWIATFLVTLGTLALLHRLLVASRGTRRFGYVLLAAAVGLSVYSLALGGGYTESFAALTCTGSMLLAATSFGRASRSFGAGVLIAASLLLSMQAIPAAVASALLLWLRAPRGSRQRSLVGAGAGILAVGGPAIAWVEAVGLTPFAIDALVTYTAAYGRLSQGSGISPLSVITVLAALGPLAVGACARVLVFRRFGRLSPEEVAAVAWLALTVAFIAYQARLEPHYAILAVTPLSILASPPLEAFAERPAGRSRGSLAAAVAIGGLLACCVVATTFLSYARYLVFTNEATRSEVAGWIDAHTDPSDRIFVWGSEPGLYDAADRPAATRWVYLLPLTTPGYSDRRQADEFLSQLEAASPRVIVDAGSPAPGEPGSIPLLISRPVLLGDGRDFDAMDGVRAYVREHYHWAATVAGWPVYIRD